MFICACYLFSCHFHNTNSGNFPIIAIKPELYIFFSHSRHIASLILQEFLLQKTQMFQVSVIKELPRIIFVCLTIVQAEGKQTKQKTLPTLH
jgi:hypothetical protein